LLLSFSCVSPPTSHLCTLSLHDALPISDIGFRQHFYQRGALGGPDFHWVVFYPTWFWVDLLKFALRHANDIGIVIHYDRAGAGGALVERNDIFFFSHV